MPQPTPVKELVTPELALAATLLASGVPLIRVEPGSRIDRMQFVFAETALALDLVPMFWAGTARVEPRAYSGAIHHLHGALRGLRDGGES
jgi:hypothetical protein